MRTASAPLQSHLAGRSQTRCWMLKLELKDGAVIGVTDHDQDLPFDLGDGERTYRADTGIFPSDVALQAGLEPDNYEVTGPIGETVSREALLGGRFNSARAWLFQVNWRSLGSGPLRFMAGDVVQTRPEGGRFVLEVHNDFHRFNQPAGRLVTNNCDADYGDSRCGAEVEAIVGTVVSAIDAMRFTVSFAGSYASGHFNLGTVQALTGSLAGTAPVEIFTWTAGGAITLFAPLADVPQVGDTFNIRRGCGKSRADCMARGNILNFRGYPEIPGSDQILRPTLPGQGNG
jgi:uncharacterized phage protein (TIGR02218 family)